MNNAISLARRAALPASLLAVLASSAAAASSPSRDTLLDTTSWTGAQPRPVVSSLLAGTRQPLLQTQLVDDGYSVRSASLLGLAGEPAGALIVVDKPDGSFVAIVDAPDNKGIVRGEQDGSQVFMPQQVSDFMSPDTLPGSDPVPQAGSIPLAPDTDADGMNVIDVVAGVSTATSQRVGDIKAYALAQMESANLGLRNSNVTNARLRLVGIQAIPQDYPITTGTLSLLPRLFGAFASQRGADLVAGFFVGNASSTAHGWANAPGRYSVQTVAAPLAFRHEVGHNAGGDHCNDQPGNYRFGYNNGRSKTFLCGNTASYYSTPLVRDAWGTPLGHARNADMARLWRERAAAMSAYAKAVIPL